MGRFRWWLVDGVGIGGGVDVILSLDNNWLKIRRCIGLIFWLILYWLVELFMNFGF